MLLCYYKEIIESNLYQVTTPGKGQRVAELSHLINRDSVFSDLLDMCLLELSLLTGP